MEVRHRREKDPLLHRLGYVDGNQIVADATDFSQYLLLQITFVPLPRGGVCCYKPGLEKTITAMVLIFKTLGLRAQAHIGFETFYALRKHWDVQHTFPYYFQDAITDVQAESEGGPAKSQRGRFIFCMVLGMISVKRPMQERFKLLSMRMKIRIAHFAIRNPEKCEYE